MLELEVGLTFCEIESSAYSQQNAANAKRAHETAMYHVQKLLLTRDERKAFNEREEQLRTVLAQFAT